MNCARAEELNSDSRNLRVVVVLVRNGETKAQAWQRYLQEHPKDKIVNIKIFHFEHQENS